MTIGATIVVAARCLESRHELCRTSRDHERTRRLDTGVEPGMSMGRDVPHATFGLSAREADRPTHGRHLPSS